MAQNNIRMPGTVSDPETKHWIIRVKDGINFRNSKHLMWGVKRGRNDCVKTIVKKMKPGDILWFMTSKPFGGKLIGMSEYTCFYDRNDEPLINLHTYSNEEQNWVGDSDWSIQIHYKNLYDTERQNIKAYVQCGGIVLEYETFKDKNLPDLYEHYRCFKYYAEPKEPIK